MKSGTCAVSGINHITLSVRALDISLSFYVEVLGMVPVARWYKGAYLLAGDMWVALTLDSETRTSPPMEYTHIAFHVPGQDFAEMERRIRNSGAPIWQENRSQGDSLYVLDPDHHKLEIHCSDLSARLDALKLQPPKDLVLYPPAQE
jgi:catechol 2,3-dioxygenase-like lactoylglutathione lyase family enzyme